jgi:peptidoglycan/xylan/chitin deacetylase (PgdA/CDA1 family)
MRIRHRLGGVPDRRLRNRSRDAIFLCYHSVAPSGPTYLTISEETFAAQLDELEALDLRAGGLAELEALAAGEETPPTVFLTFDDGFLDNHRTVLPMLKERGMKAFVFVIPPLVDEGAALSWPEMAEDVINHPSTLRSLRWEMLELMRDVLFEVGAHTLTHPHLPELDESALTEELAESRARIIEQLGTCDTLAYPFGEWSPRVAAAAADCGYRFAFTLPTTHGQSTADELTIPRINIDSRDVGARFRFKLSPTGRRIHLSPTTRALRRGLKRLQGN